MKVKQSQTLKADGKMFFIIAFFIGCLWLPASVTFAQSEYGGDDGPLTITSPCDDTALCQPICGSSVTVTIVDTDPNAGDVYVTLNGGTATKIGTGPGTFTPIVTGLIQGNDGIQAYDSDTASDGNWDAITVPSNGGAGSGTSGGLSVVESDGGPWNPTDQDRCGELVNESIWCIPVPDGTFTLWYSEDNSDGKGDSPRDITANVVSLGHASLTDHAGCEKPCSIYFFPSTWVVDQTIDIAKKDIVGNIQACYTFSNCSERCFNVAVGYPNIHSTTTSVYGPSVYGNISAQCGPTTCN